MRLAVYHNHDEDPNRCNGIAFYMVKELHVGDKLMPDAFEFLNGVRPTKGDPIICGCCGRPIRTLGPENLVEPHDKFSAILGRSRYGC